MSLNDLAPEKKQAFVFDQEDRTFSCVCVFCRKLITSKRLDNYYRESLYEGSGLNCYNCKRKNILYSAILFRDPINYYLLNTRNSGVVHLTRVGNLLYNKFTSIEGVISLMDDHEHF